MNFVDIATGFPVPFGLVGTVPTTNAHGASITYLVYKSVNIVG
jgi:hypothetical protein